MGYVLGITGDRPGIGHEKSQGTGYGPREVANRVIRGIRESRDRRSYDRTLEAHIDLETSGRVPEVIKRITKLCNRGFLE